jgi:hypothetical protein
MELSTLVFPSDSIGQPNKSIDSIPVQLNSPSQSPSEGAVMSPAAGPAPIIHHHQFSHPAAVFNQFVVSLVDHSLLKLCQDGDVGTVTTRRYLALHHEKVPAKSLNAVDATGKVKKKNTIINASYIVPFMHLCPFCARLLVPVEEEHLDLLPNFLIASDRNIRVDHNRISIRISSSSWFKFPI